MIYAYDQALQMPTRDLYDTQMMLASIQAAKDLYNDRQKQLEDFNKLYDDFYSPIAEDNADYNKLTSGRVRDALNYMYQNGIDPLRSAEGGALLSRIINTTPTREINAIKQNAAAKIAYDKAVEDAKKAGTYNEEFEQQLLEKLNLQNFRTLGPNDKINTWGRKAPGVFKSLHDFAEPEYNKFDATEYIGQSRPGYNLYGVSKANQDLASEAALNQLKTNPELYSYYANKAQDYKTEEESTDDALRRMINQDAQHWLQPKEIVDPYYEMQQKANIELATNKAIIDAKLKADEARWNNPNNPAVLREKRLNTTSKSKTSGKSDENGVYDYVQSTIRNGVANIIGVNPALLDMDQATKTIYDSQQEKINALATKTTSASGKTTYSYDNVDTDSILKLFKYIEDPKTLQEFLPYDHAKTSDDKANAGDLLIDENMKQNLYASDYVATNASGYGAKRKSGKGSKQEELRKQLDNNTYKYCKLTDQQFTLLENDGRVHTYQKAILRDASKDKTVTVLLDTKIQTERRSEGQYYLDDMLGELIDRSQPLSPDSKLRGYYNTAGIRVNKHIYGSVDGKGAPSIDRTTVEDENIELLEDYLNSIYDYGSEE